MGIKKAIAVCDECAARSENRPLSYLVIGYILRALAQPDEVSQCRCLKPILNKGICVMCHNPTDTLKPIIHDEDTQKAYDAGFLAGQKEITDLLGVAWSKAYMAGNAMDGFFILQGVMKRILCDEVRKEGQNEV